MAKVLNFVPRVEHNVILVGTRECELYAYVARPGLTTLGVWYGAVLVVEANSRIPRARITPELLPVQALERAFLELEDL